MTSTLEPCVPISILSLIRRRTEKEERCDPVIGRLTGDARFALEPNRDCEFHDSIVQVGKAQSIVIAAK